MRLCKRRAVRPAVKGPCSCPRLLQLSGKQQSGHLPVHASNTLQCSLSCHLGWQPDLHFI